MESPWFNPSIRTAADLGGADARRAAEVWGREHRFHPPYALTRFEIAVAPAEWPPAFALVTGWATTGESWSESANLAANARLLARLEADGRWHHPVAGVSPDTRDREPGWAVAWPLEAARRLGAEFRQDAIYWIEGDALHVVGCEPESPRHAPLDCFRARLVLGTAAVLG